LCLSAIPDQKWLKSKTSGIQSKKAPRANNWNGHLIQRTTVQIRRHRQGISQRGALIQKYRKSQWHSNLGGATAEESYLPVHPHG
jgi:hypothetical protein